MRRQNEWRDKYIAEYIARANKTKLLTAEEERELATRVKQGDMAAQEQFVEANLRLVGSVAKNYVNRGIPLWDLIQEGNSGLLKAIEGFDPARGFRFSTYAIWRIKQRIRRVIADQSRLVRVPCFMQELAARLKNIPNEKERRSEINALPKETRDGLTAYIHGPNKKSVADINAVSEFAAATEDPETPDHRNEIAALLPALSDRERALIKLRYGLPLDTTERKFTKLPGELKDGALTLADVGKQLGVTRERIRQIEKKALEKMRKYAPRKLKKK